MNIPSAAWPQRRIVDLDLERICSAPLPWSRLFGKTILITGANGFVPAYMVETLLFLNKMLDAHAHVIALVRNHERALRRFAGLGSRPDLTLVVQDVRETYTGPRPDFIVHAASQASPKYYGSDPAGTFETNVTGTLRMLELAREAQIESLLFFSSGEVYGSHANLSHPVRETDFGVSIRRISVLAMPRENAPGKHSASAGMHNTNPGKDHPALAHLWPWHGAR